MNKNTKKFVVTLLSVLMVLSFMPTIAFAGLPGSAEEGHDFTPLADDSNVEVIVEPTCTKPGYGIVKCTLKAGDLECGATETQLLPALGHERKDNAITVTADEYYAQKIKEGYTKAYMDQWMLDYGNDMCTGTVSVCKNCGAFLREGTNTVSNPYMFGPYVSREHVAPTGANAPKDCAASFKCVKCGKPDATNATYNQTQSDTYHGLKADGTYDVTNGHWTVKGPSYKAHSVAGVGDVTVQVYKCNECDLETKVVTITSGTNLSQYPHPNTTTETTDPTCETVGVTKTICKDCGFEISRSEKPALGHDYKSTTVAVATETSGEEVADVCTRCNAEKAGTRQTVSLPLAHKVKAEVFAPKNCVQDSWVLVTCENPDCAAADNGVILDELADVNKVGSKYYYTFDAVHPAKQVITEVPFEEATGHEYGDKKIIAEATCTTPQIEGRICDKCGAIYHTGTREVGDPLGHEVTTFTVEPTCGAYGFMYDSCSRCKQIVLPEGAKDTGYMYVEALGANADVYNVKDPIVSEGTPCKYEWYVTEPATATKEGKKVLKCTVCGHEKEGSETVVPIDPTEADKAADAAIEAATDVLDKKAQYTPDSIEAIKDAIKDLNTARIIGDAAAIGRATEKLNQVVAAAVPKKANTMTVKTKTVKAKAKKNTTFKKSKAFTVKKAKGKVSFKKVSGNKKITVTSAGKVAVKKGLKAGKTYKVKVMVTAAGNDNYLAKAKTVTLKVKVK